MKVKPLVATDFFIFYCLEELCKLFPDPILGTFLVDQIHQELRLILARCVLDMLAGVLD